MTMNKYYKIYVKREHERKSDIVIKPLFREYEKLDNMEYFNVGKYIFILAYKDMETGKMFDLFTNHELNVNQMNYEEISEEEVIEMLNSVDKDTIGKMVNILNSFYNHTMEVTMEDKARDRYELFNEYNRGLSDINPYDQDDTQGYMYSKKI